MASRFLSVEDVLVMHENAIENEGGSAGIRDPGLLESAVLMPQQRFGGELLHPEIAEQAAAYLFHIAQNHPFLDGSKRTAALAALVFLSVNGAPSLPEPAAMERMVLKLAASKVSKSELTDWMRGQLDRTKAP